MKKSTIFTLALTSLMVSCAEKPQPQEIFFADPTIFVENNQLYMSGTRNREPLGFSLLESDNLKEWSPIAKADSGMILYGANRRSFGTNGFWAPQILKIDSRFALTYTADEQTVVAYSNDLLGPYTQDSIAPIDSSEKNIDSFIFTDEDGKSYIYHVRFDNGNYLWVAEYDLKAGKMKLETLTKCFSNTQDWENTPSYPSSPIMEGPTVLKMDGKYYMLYSANHFMSVDYGVGYATSTSPFGPWVKSDNNPIIHRTTVGENGAGHGDLFYYNNRPYYVYHVHYSNTQVTPRRTRIVPLTFDLDQSTGYYNISIENDQVIIPTLSNN